MARQYDTAPAQALSQMGDEMSAPTSGVARTLADVYQGLVEWVRTFDNDPIITTLGGSVVTGITTAVAVGAFEALVGMESL